MVPFDTRSPFVTSGIRIGTAAMTTRGMQAAEMRIIAGLIDKALQHCDDEKVIHSIRQEVRDLCQEFPLYQELNV